MNQSPRSDKTGCRHPKSLAGWAFKDDVHLDPFVFAQECCIVASLNEIKVEIDLFHVFAVHVSDRNDGWFRRLFFDSLVGNNPRIVHAV